MSKGWSSFMDRRVKERLVGATILVVLIVLIVPELLSGPKQSARVPAPVSTAELVRNVTVDLATSKATPEPEVPAPVASEPPAATLPATTPSATTPSATMPSGAPPVAPPTISTLQAQQPPAASALEKSNSSPKYQAARPGEAARDSAADGGHHHWGVQLGSFASQANAERLTRQLKSQGFAAYILSSGAGGSSMYRVRVGPMADRASAERVSSRLRKVGHSASVISP